MTVGRTYSFGPWDVSLSNLSFAGDGRGGGVGGGEVGAGAGKPPAALTMADVVKGLLSYDLHVHHERAPSNPLGCEGADEKGGRAGGAGASKAVVAEGQLQIATDFEIEPLACLPVCRQIPKARAHALDLRSLPFNVFPCACRLRGVDRTRFFCGVRVT